MAHSLLDTVLEYGQDEHTPRGTRPAGPPPFFPKPPDDSGDDGGRSDDDGHERLPLRHARFAMFLFLSAETVFFCRFDRGVSSVSPGKSDLAAPHDARLTDTCYRI
jgi:hypothetical protein